MKGCFYGDNLRICAIPFPPYYHTWYVLLQEKIIRKNEEEYWMNE
jgi:hypothetical protein